MKNGAQGPPILLKRPKDATLLKIHPNYRSRMTDRKSGARMIKRDISLRKVKSVKPMPKEREKLVCPVCGILTYTLTNHIATHEGNLLFNYFFICIFFSFYLNYIHIILEQLSMYK